MRRSIALVLLAFGGCQCGEDVLVDTRPKLEVAPASLDFGEIRVGELRVLGLELRNSGGSAVAVTTTLAPARGEFSFGSAVPTALAAQQKVMIAAVYSPIDLGEDRGTITFKGEGLDPLTVSLRGVGVESGAAIEREGGECQGVPGSISFGSVRPGMSAERRITVKSQGGLPLKVISARVEAGASGEWSIDASQLPKTIAPGESLVLVARYTPIDGGIDQGGFVIETDAAKDAIFHVPACGAGVAPAICARPVPLELGAVPQGQSARRRLTIESCGEEPLDLTAVDLATDAQHPSSPAFRLTRTPTVPATLSPGATVEVEVEYTARAPVGPADAWVHARSNASGAADAYFPVHARTASPCDLFLAPGAVFFRGVMAGQRATRTVLIGNSGETSCTISMVSVTSTSGTEFSLAAPRPAFTLAAGATETVDVAYAPQNAGPHAGRLEVTDSGGGVKRVLLFGNPPDPTGCAIDVTPSAVSFGVTAIGTTVHMGVRVTAIGEDPCRVTSARLLAANPSFALTVPVLRTAFPGLGGVTLDVAYSPTSAAPSSDVIQIDYAALRGGPGSGTVLVGVTGRAAEARICVTPPALDFGTVQQGTTAQRGVMITSCGAADLRLRGALISSGANNFVISRPTAVPQVIAAGANAAPTLTVTYAPATPGPHFGQLEILSTDARAPAVHVPLTGNFAGNCDRVLQCSPSSVAFGDTDVGTSKIVRVVCTSAGTSTVTVRAVALAGGPPDLGLIGAQTPVTLAPGRSFSFDVRFSPSAAGAASATLSIASDACIEPPAAAVSANGREVVLPPCQPPSTFSPRAQWVWAASRVMPTFTNVWSTPLVANLDDDNRDGRIDENDVPDVIFISLDSYSISDPAASIPGVLRVVSGDTGNEKFSVTEPRFADTSILAVGDLDGDGRPEIVGCKWVQTPMGMGMGGIFGRYVTGTLVALDNTGRLLWESDPWMWPQEISFNAAGPAIADLDGDGFAEIVLGREVYDHLGKLLWRGTKDYGNAAAGPHSIVADLDLDGRPEVIAGGTVYRADGSVMWELTGVRDGGTAVGMLDAMDPFPQVVLHTGSGLMVVDHLGMMKWSANIPTMGPATMLPTLADFDGDGDADIAVADGEGLHVYRGTGGIMWSGPSNDSTCCPGISAFDFEGDGPYELILNDNGQVYVFRGTDGTELYRAPRLNPTAFEMPVVADIDNDKKAELVVALFAPGGMGGITAYSNVGDTWVAAPRIFNQQSYHVTNVYESGAIPRLELPLPRAPRVFRGTNAACR